MPWRLPQELAGRVRRARCLLEEAEAHVGSADLQLLIASVEASEQLDRHWLKEDGSAKQGLSTRDKQQALELLVAETQGSQADPGCLQLLGAMACVLIQALTTGEFTREPPIQRLRRLLEQPPLLSWDGAAAAELQRYQGQQGFQPAISVQQLQQVYLLARFTICNRLAGERQLGAEEEEQLARRMEQDSRQLCRLHPNNLHYMMHHAMALLGNRQAQNGASQLAETLHVAGQTNSHLSYCLAACCLLPLVPLITPGRRKAEVAAHTMLCSASESLALAEGWTAPEVLHSLHKALSRARSRLAQAGVPLEQLPQGSPAQPQPANVAPPSAPGSATQRSAVVSTPVAPQPLRQPTTPGGSGKTASQPDAPQTPTQPAAAAPAAAAEAPAPSPSAERCSLGGQAATALVRCGRCGTTTYCGRRCQVQHFREGHHEECTAIVKARVAARLAASPHGSGGGSGGGSSGASDGGACGSS